MKQGSCKASLLPTELNDSEVGAEDEVQGLSLGRRHVGMPEVDAQDDSGSGVWGAWRRRRTVSFREETGLDGEPCVIH